MGKALQDKLFLSQQMISNAFWLYDNNLTDIIAYFKNWALPGLFFFIFVFSIQLMVN